MIHICLALHDAEGAYSKYTGAAICSLFENTVSKITIHLIHDDTLNENSIDYFKLLCKKYNQSIYFYCMDNKINLQFEKILKIRKTTIGTFFRLYIPNILPQDIEKVIYLDSDIIVNINIKELWDIDLNENILAARHDPEGERYLSSVNMVERDKYFNAGVLVVNLKKLRDCNIKIQQYLDFLIKYPKCIFADQDALNFFYKDKILYLESKYNNFTFLLRKKDFFIIDNAIYHFAGDYIDPIRMDAYDKLFFKYLKKTPWNNFSQNIKSLQCSISLQTNQILLYQKILLKLTKTSCKKIIFGATSVMQSDLKQIIHFNSNIDYYVDNNINIQGNIIDEMKIYSPDIIKKENIDEIIVFVLSNDYYNDIKEQLIGYGLKENENFFNGKKLLLQNNGGDYVYR